ncbi:uncharacterized protein TRAVEDRAFT_52709 [Trametes versicolor FP-101664 SS1]|uniref:uncharacterized protein n=1 Tax=Trametes versicolor (strain FP-101664) TaxID=717944 RepID=UPI0004623F8D|nr:uncharacterized protein TRAVEDRAFT_52709 [Trametes versicolor FP-101664 SS1]EIW53587.1 hypothetical protein TRAVEDRAFT_52709 [Trametes versicolor FP-101664 SS1]
MASTSNYVSVSHGTDIHVLPANSEPASPSTDDHYETLFDPCNVLAQWTLTHRVLHSRIIADLPTDIPQFHLDRLLDDLCLSAPKMVEREIWDSAKKEDSRHMPKGYIFLNELAVPHEYEAKLAAKTAQKDYLHPNVSQDEYDDKDDCTHDDSEAH